MSESFQFQFRPEVIVTLTFEYISLPVLYQRVSSVFFLPELSFIFFKCSRRQHNEFELNQWQIKSGMTNDGN